MVREDAEGRREELVQRRRRLAGELGRIAAGGGAAAAPAKRARVEADEELLLREEGDGGAAAASDDDGAEGSAGLRGPPNEAVRVFYTSRTHSQLKQFCAELRRTGYFCKSPTVQAPEDMLHEPQIWTTSLGARGALCVQESVRTRGGGGEGQAISEACRQRREGKGGCESNQAARVEALAAECLKEGLADVEVRSIRFCQVVFSSH